MRSRRIFGLLSALVFAASGALAQPAPTPEEVQQAQVRWNEGKAFYDAGNFEAARVAFKQAFTIFPHPVFLQNLGEAELRAGRSVEAARHLEAFLRTANTASAAQRESAKKSLKKASEKLASIVISTNETDAEIRVDEDVVGRSPLGALEWYLEPGRHVVVARKEGYLDGSEQVFVTIGASKTVVVRVQRVAEAGSSPEPAARGSIDPPHVADTSSLEPRTIVLASGVVLTVAALTLGTVYVARVATDRSRIDDARITVRGASDCGPPSPLAACADLAHYATRLPTDRNVRNAAFVSAGVLGAATAAAWLLWRPAPRNLALGGFIEPGQYGLAIFGNF
jgi:hypothetical protein